MKKLLTAVLSITMATSHYQVSILADSIAQNSTYNLSVESDEYQELVSNGEIPYEVMEYVLETQERYPDSRIELVGSVGNENSIRSINYTNKRTYAGHELADYTIHVVNAHNMQNILTGASAGGFASNLLYYFGSGLIGSKLPFYSTAVTAAEYLYTNGTFHAYAGDKLNAAPAYDTYCKFTYVKWNGNYSLGVQSFKAKSTTVSWYLWSQKDQRQYTGTCTYNYTFTSAHYNSPDNAAVNNYQAGGLYDPQPKMKIGSRYFSLY